MNTNEEKHSPRLDLEKSNKQPASSEKKIGLQELRPLLKEHGFNNVVRRGEESGDAYIVAIREIAEGEELEPGGKPCEESQVITVRVSPTEGRSADICRQHSEPHEIPVKPPEKVLPEEVWKKMEECLGS